MKLQFIHIIITIIIITTRDSNRIPNTLPENSHIALTAVVTVRIGNISMFCTEPAAGTILSIVNVQSESVKFS
jgi:hypothetical protein